MATKAKLAAVAASSYRATLAILALSADAAGKKITVSSAHRAWESFALTKNTGISPDL